MPNARVDYNARMPPQPNLLSPKKKEPAGPMVGVVIIVILAIFGALYFYGAVMSSRNAQREQLPLITGSDYAPTVVSTTTD